MRLYSTPESVKRGEVSVLAIAETLAAVTLLFWLSSYFNTLKWLAGAMCVAPLLLLRTEASTKIGIQSFERLIQPLSRLINRVLSRDSRTKLANFIVVILAAFVFSVIATNIVALCARVYATICSVFTQPLEALKAIPTNWARLTAAVDPAVLPEVVPDHPEANMREILRGKEGSEWLVAVLFMIPVTIPALCYRWALKATSIIYAPLVFVLQSTFRHVADLRKQLELIKRSDLTRIAALYAVVFIAAFLLKLVLMMSLPGFAAWWQGHPMSQFAALYVAPAEIPCGSSSRSPIPWSRSP